jgi:hypothetical protein
MGTLTETTIQICVEATRLPDQRKKDEQKTKILYCYCKMEFLQEKSVCENEIRAKDEILHAEEGGESGLVIVMGRITRAITKNREVG